MRILLIHYGEVDDYPPIKSFINATLELGCDLTIASYDKRNYIKRIQTNQEVKLINFSEAREYRGIIGHYVKRGRLRKIISNSIPHYDVIWTTTFWTAILFRKELKKANKHVLQLMELQENRRLYNIRRIYLGDTLSGSIGECARHAWKVVMPEYNRAHIAKAWWNLRETPIILPNKPYITSSSFIPEYVAKVCQDAKNLNKKIVLYQGYFSAERRLDELAEAVTLLGDDYKLCIMGVDNDERKRLCKKYPNISYLGFISAPDHLRVTELAYIGVLTYYPQKGEELNGLFCAPNKLFEYAYCNLPMIGNDIPGLSLPFEKYGIGVCYKDNTPQAICSAIREVENNYVTFKNNCIGYYNSVDVKQIIREIIEK